MNVDGHTQTQTFSWVDPGQVARESAALSGIEYMRALRDGAIPPPPIAVLMQFRPIEVEEGRVVFECDPSIAHYNPIGMVHGGLVCTLLDTVVGCAAHTTLPSGTGYTSIDITVSYLKPVFADSGTLTAAGTVQKAGSRVIFASGSVADREGTLLATATSSLLVIAPRR